jgi:hypothetical protein
MERIVLSASRRTDIPAFYMPWFMAGIDQGYFDVANPVSRKVARVPADPRSVHSIVFWSKDFGPFLKNGYGERLAKAGYGLFFNFTINTPHALFEPHLPPLAERLAQLAELSRRFGPAAIQWRFDPICHFTTPTGEVGDNLGAFEEICNRAAGVGITVCIASFVDLYRKVQRRFAERSNVSLIDPAMARKVEIVLWMERQLRAAGIALRLCCEKEVLAALPVDSTVTASACIPVNHLAALYGPGISLRQDPGQRAAAGCTCGLSRDIGDYGLHLCRHDCLYCYARPIGDR